MSSFSGNSSSYVFPSRHFTSPPSRILLQSQTKRQQYRDMCYSRPFCQIYPHYEKRDNVLEKYSAQLPTGCPMPMLGWLSYFSQRVTTEFRATCLPQNTVWLCACLLTLLSCGQYSRKRKIFHSLLMCESPFYLCVPLTRSAPGFCRQLCFAGHQTICSADLIFNSFCVFYCGGQSMS